MKYLRIINGEIVYPYSINELKSEFPTTSFPDIINFVHLNDYEVYNVKPITKPSDENYSKLITEGIPELINGEYYQKWVVTDAPSDYTLTMRKQDLKFKFESDKRIAVQSLIQQELITKAQESTTNDDIVKYKNLYPLWEDFEDGFSFPLELKVNYIDDQLEIRLFKCIQSHNKQSNFNPVVTPALWSEIIIGNGGIEVWTQPIGGDGKYPYIDPLTGNPYIVTHNGFTWQNNHQGGLNVWEPGVFGWVQV